MNKTRYCKDCKWAELTTVGCLIYFRCLSVHQGYDLVEGTLQWKSCKEERYPLPDNSVDKCGPEAKFFEAQIDEQATPTDKAEISPHEQNL